jgi:RimJ/RimL family protein N-acetyltransferase
MVKLERFEKNDFQRLINWVDTEELLVQFGGPIFSFPLTFEQLEEYISDPKRSIFKVIELPSNNVIGHAELVPSDFKTVKICRILVGDESKRGKGLGQGLINELLEMSFLQLGYEKAELNVYDWNIGAIKCYEKNGFMRNPDKVNSVEVNGNIWTALNMTVLKSDWLKLL